MITNRYATASSVVHSSARIHCAAATQVTRKITLATVSPGPRQSPRRINSAATAPNQNSSDRTGGKIWVNHQRLTSGTNSCAGQSARISSGSATISAQSSFGRARRSSGSASGRQR